MTKSVSFKKIFSKKKPELKTNIELYTMSISELILKKSMNLENLALSYKIALLFLSFIGIIVGTYLIFSKRT